MKLIEVKANSDITMLIPVHAITAVSRERNVFSDGLDHVCIWTGPDRIVVEESYETIKEALTNVRV